MAWLTSHWDVVLFVVLMGIHFLSWTELQHRLPGASDDGEERQAAEKSLSDAVKTAITVAAILIPSAFVIAKLSPNDGVVIPKDALALILRGALWCLASLFPGVALSFYLPMRSQQFVVTKDKPTAMFLGLQILALLLGILTFLVGSLAAVMST